MYSGNQVKGWLRTTFWVGLVVMSAFYYWMLGQVAPLTGKEIVAFETAMEADTANAYLLQWQATGIKKEKLQTSIYLDYIFIILYVSVISTACRFFSILAANNILKKAGTFFSWLIVGAGICDLIENLIMTRSIGHGATSATAAWPYYMAVTKFSIILICLLFIVFCVLMYLVQLISKKE
jgi:hypothetical protein